MIKLEPEKFSCLLSCRTSDLNKESPDEHDDYWDYEAEKEDVEKDRSAKNLKVRHIYDVCRVTIKWPAWL